jgi:hypothetical protein
MKMPLPERSKEWDKVRESSRWWPVDFGTPSTSSSSDGLRYAFFPLLRRLVIEWQGALTVYDTGEYQFRGVLHGLGAKPSFMSQRGRVNLDDMPVISTVARRLP